MAIGDTKIEAGAVTFALQYRAQMADQGVCIHVMGEVDGSQTELLRFDCFDGDQGHCHVNMSQTGGQRWYYPPGTVRQHIDRTAFEISRNVPFALRTNQDPAIRTMKIDPEKLKEVAQQTRERLLELTTQQGF